MEKKTLAEILAELESTCLQIDEETGEIPKELLEKLTDLKDSQLADKVDDWILKLDQISGQILAAKLKKERAEKAVKRWESLQKGMKDYLKFIIQNNPGVAFKGDEGTIYLHKNPPGVDVDFERKNKTVYNAIDESFATLDPTLGEYMKEVRYFVVDGEKLKADILSGKKLNWAREKQDSHIRIKG